MQISVLARAQEIGDVFEHEEKRLDRYQRIDVSAPQGIAWISNLASAQI